MPMKLPEFKAVAVFNVLSDTPPGRSLRRELNPVLLIRSEVTATYRTREFIEE